MLDFKKSLQLTNVSLRKEIKSQFAQLQALRILANALYWDYMPTYLKSNNLEVDVSALQLDLR